MLCKVCNAENKEDAKFCKTCGSMLIESSCVCPQCSTVNSSQAQFCKTCGSALTTQKEKAEELSVVEQEHHQKKKLRFVFQIVMLCLSAFVILYSFGVTFSSFAEVSVLSSSIPKAKLDIFQVIQNLKYTNNEIIEQGGAYWTAANVIPNVVSLIAILVSMIGCFVFLILAVIKAIKQGSQKKIPNLDAYAIGSTGFLMVGLCLVQLNHIGFSVSLFNDFVNLGLDGGVQYGSLVLSAVCIGLSAIFLRFVLMLIVRCLEKCGRKEILVRCFKFVEIVLLVILVFNVATGFASMKFPINQVDVSVWFSGLSYFLYTYGTAGLLHVEGFSLPNVLTNSLVNSTLFMIFMIAISIVFLILFIQRIRLQSKNMQSSLGCGIVFFVLSVAFMIWSVVSMNVISNDTTLFKVLSISLNTAVDDTLKTSLSANVIITLLFSAGLLALEIVWRVLVSKNSIEIEV